MDPRRDRIGPPRGAAVDRRDRRPRDDPHPQRLPAAASSQRRGRPRVRRLRPAAHDADAVGGPGQRQPHGRPRAARAARAGPRRRLRAVPDDLLTRLDAGIPHRGVCDARADGPYGACAPPEERFADTFAKWALRGAVSSVGAGYLIPTPSSLEEWGALSPRSADSAVVRAAAQTNGGQVRGWGCRPAWSTSGVGGSSAVIPTLPMTWMFNVGIPALDHADPDVMHARATTTSGSPSAMRPRPTFCTTPAPPPPFPAAVQVERDGRSRVWEGVRPPP